MEIKITFGNDVWTFVSEIDFRIEIEIVSNEVRNVRCVALENNDKESKSRNNLSR